MLLAEGIKQSEILKAEGEKQSQILAAEGRLAAANKDAEARERLATAEAMATKVVSEAVEGGNVQALNYFIAQKYVEAMQAIGQSTEFQAGADADGNRGLVSSIAGIAEIAKDSLAQVTKKT